MWAFYGAWFLTLCHAVLRKRTAWREQAWAIVLLGVLAVVFNAATTGHHLGASLGQGLWVVAGMDLLLLASSALALVAALRLPADGALVLKTKKAVPKNMQQQGATGHA